MWISEPYPTKSKKVKTVISIFGGTFDLDHKRERLGQLEDTINADPNFWNNPTLSAKILKEKKSVEDSIARAEQMHALCEDLDAAAELAAEGIEFLEEAQKLHADFREALDELEIQNLLSGEVDNNAAIVTLNAGAGGTESCDWAAMLMRMYLRFAETRSWEANIHDVQDGDEAGVKSCTFEIDGPFAFGLLKAESGVHRLVRISPFDSNARRHTSFVSVFVTPVISDDIEININPADLRVDTYRASGAGGQHVNRTDSAVRITHQPSGIVVQCQSQRSQHQNRDTAMKMLKSRLYDRELEERRKKQQETEDNKSAIDFGSQIRSYVLHPYKMVKDHRTNHESHSPNDVLDGDIGSFINSYLHHSKS